MNRNKSIRSRIHLAIVLGLTTLTLSSGCASMKSGKWFSKNAGTISNTPGSNIATTLSNTGKGITGQFKSMGTAVSSAMGKAKKAVTNTFTVKPENTDPTSLATMPTSLGPEIWVVNGQRYEAKGDYSSALNNYTKALEMDPKNQSALLSTARLYVRQEKNQQAIEFFKKSIDVQPDAAIYNELAQVEHKLGKLTEAQAAVQKAIDLDPSNARYRNNLAGMLVAAGRSDEAVKQLEQVFPAAMANYNVAYLHFTNQNIAAAQQHLQTALAADPNLKPARDLLERLGGSQTTQSAMAAYGNAQQIYRTAQAVASAQVPAVTAPYQMPQQPTATNQSATSRPSIPTGGTSLLPAVSQASQPTTPGTTTSTGANRYNLESLAPPTHTRQ